MITLSEVLLIHQNVLKLHSGANGIRDFGGLGSAIARPFQTFGEEYLYSNSFEKAASIGESIIMNHPFIDGNKRTDFVAMYSFLIHHKLTITADSNNMYQFIISISTSSINFEQIVEWLKTNTTKITT